MYYFNYKIIFILILIFSFLAFFLSFDFKGKKTIRILMYLCITGIFSLVNFMDYLILETYYNFYSNPIYFILMIVAYALMLLTIIREIWKK